jgi:hypothetical protein
MSKKTSPDRCELCAGKVSAGIIGARFAFRGRTVFVNHVPTWGPGTGNLADEVAVGREDLTRRYRKPRPAHA